jgi:hypothetical protein
LLRSFGKQITLSTNKEACRDLTGRRIKHVNNEKKLREFLEKQSELAKQKEEAKKERAERRKKKRDRIEAKHHLFVDPKYDQQKEKIAQDLDEAITKAIANKKQQQSEENNNTEENPKLVVNDTKIEATTSTNRDQTQKKETIAKPNDLEVSSSSSDEEELPAKSMF